MPYVKEYVYLDTCVNYVFAFYIMQVGSYAYDENKMKFSTNYLNYPWDDRNTILDYSVLITPLKEEDSTFVWQSIGNYSQTGFEMTMRRNSLKYLVNYYLPSGLFVFVSWVRPKIWSSVLLSLIHI